jgi:RHS repeat-associated protein
VRGAHGLPTAVRGPGGELRLERAEGGLLVAAVAADGARVEYERDERGNLARVRRGAVQESYAWDEAGRLVGLAGGLGRLLRDEAGLVTRFEARGRPTVTLEPVTPPPAGALVAVRRVRGDERTLFLVDASLRRFEERPEAAGAPATVVDLDARMRPVRRLLGGAEQERLEWDAQGRLSRRVDAEGATRWLYSGPGARLPAAVEHSRRGTLRLIQDAQGRLLGWQAPDGRFGRVQADGEGRPTGLHAPGGASRLERDEAGRLARLSGPQGGWEVERDARGQVTRLVREGGGALELAATAAGGRLVRARDAAGRVVREVETDALGRAVRALDRRGQRRAWEWDEAGLLRRVRDGSGALVAELEWDAEGRLAALIDPLGHRTRFLRPDARTLVVEDPAAGSRTLRRDAEGRLVEQLRGEVRIGYAYDAAGRLVRRDTPAGPETFEWDAAGRLVAMQGPDGGLRFGWDDRGRLVRVDDPALGAGIAWRWDEAGRRVEARYPWGTVRYERDAAGRLTALALPEGQRIEVERLPDGRRSAVRYPNGVVTRWEWDGLRLREVRTARGEELLDLRRYGHDEQGRVAWVEDARGARTSFARDARGRLGAAEGPDGRAAWAWDEAGNRTEAALDGLVAAARHGDGNRLLAAGEERFAFDPHGALIGRQGPAGETRYEWDHHRRLTRAVLPDGREVRWGYAPNGMRLWREGPGGRTRFLQDLAGAAAEYGPDGRLAQGWVLGDELDEVLAVRRGDETCFFHQDLVQNVTALTDARGDVAGRWSYDPFGRELAAEGPAAAWNHLRFSSRPRDPDTGLVDLRARQYAPELGRFLTPDPAAQTGGMNLYAYVNGDPTAATDPRGLWPSIPNPIDALDDAWDATTDVIGGGADLIGGGASWAWDNVGAPAVDGVVSAADWYVTDFALGPNHNPFFFGPVPNPFAIEESIAFGRGVLHGTFDLVAAPFMFAHSLVTDPLGTLENLNTFLIYTNPATMLPAMLMNGGRNPIWEGVAGVGLSYLNALFTDPEGFWEMTGYATPQVAALIATMGGSSFLSASSALAKLALVLEALRAVGAGGSGGGGGFGAGGSGSGGGGGGGAY